MEEDVLTRRNFVVAIGALGAVWMTGDPVARLAALTHADAQLAEGAAPAYLTFTAEQAVEIVAMTSRIVPSDDGTPGAREAGVVFFIDKSLTTFAKDQRERVVAGLVTLGDAVAAKYPGERKLSALTVDQQDAILKGIEHTPFFNNIRFATLSGLLSQPQYGGNRGMVGWKLMGEKVSMEHTAPFGWYDRPENRKTLMGTSE